MAEAFYDYPLPCGCALLTGRCDRHAAMMGAIRDFIDDESGSRAEQNGRILAIMDRADGYGEPGFFPAGYDWSGIRDSTVESIEQMYAVTGHGK